jgi:RNA-directed DNA polymerase
MRVSSKPVSNNAEWLPLFAKGNCLALANQPEHPVGRDDLLERVLERANLIRALRQVERNGGSAGVDGMKVEELRPYLKENWLMIRDSILNGTYRPQPVRRVETPKPGGGVRKLGIPIVLDRFIQQAIHQVLQELWEPKFSAYSFGFRPGRSAHQAIYQSQKYIRRGYSWVVDIDLEQFFDRVNHDLLMSCLKEEISDKRILRLINLYLRSGVMIVDSLHETPEGTPQGGPLSPLLANILLDNLDKELEKRGHRFVRYADDCNVYVRSKRSAKRVLKSLSRYLLIRLKLSVNKAKSAVGRPWERKFLGFTFTRRLKRRLSNKALKQFKNRIKELTRRTRGRNIGTIVKELRRYLLGWSSYYGYIEIRSILKELDSWIRRKLRCYLWKQWGRRQYRELRNRGISRTLAWNSVKSAHGPWRLSRSPALSIALPGKYFDSMGLPRMYGKPT